jgi:hypothetical protein
MSTKENKAVVQRFWEEIVNHQNLASIDELHAAKTAEWLNTQRTFREAHPWKLH